MNDEQPDTDEWYRQVLEGLRTSLPGVQVLFAFLLILPFQAGFDRVTTFERTVYYVAFSTAAVSSILLIAPSAYQRVRRALHDHHFDESDVQLAIRLAVAGTLFFVVTLTSVTFLVTILVLGAVSAVVAAVAIVTLMSWAWFMLPLSRRSH